MAAVSGLVRVAGSLKFPLLTSFTNRSFSGREIFKRCTLLYNHKYYIHQYSSFPTIKHNVLVKDESDKDIGVMKWNRLKSLSIEKGLNIKCIDKDAQPHAIYKLVKNVEIKEKEDKSETKKLKIHQRTLKLSSNISKNDLGIKIKHIIELLGKNNIVKVIISFSPNSIDKKHIEIYNDIIEATSNLSRIQKSKTTDRELSFDLISNSCSEILAESNLKPFTLQELKSKTVAEKTLNDIPSMEQNKKVESNVDTSKDPDVQTDKSKMELLNEEMVSLKEDQVNHPKHSAKSKKAKKSKKVQENDNLEKT